MEIHSLYAHAMEIYRMTQELRRGHRVVTNIPVDVEAMKAYLLKRYNVRLAPWQLRVVPPETKIFLP